MLRDVAAVRPLAAAALLVLALAAGCGGDDEKPGERPATTSESEASSSRDPLIDREDISEAGRTTPAATLLVWWQSLQFNDPETARRQYADDVRPTGLAPAIRKLNRSIAASALEVHESTIDGERARVLVVIRTDIGGGGAARIEVSPATFRLVREDGRWKLADNRYLTARMRAVEDAERASRGG